MLYQINDLREVGETAKRLLTKEQVDKKAGQSSASPFMQLNQSSSKNKDKTEKKVSFSVVEAMERTTDSIERLASLIDKMDTKLDRREDQYRPRVYQGRSRGCGYRQNNYGSRNRSYSRYQYQNSIGEEEITAIEVVIENIGPIIEISVGPEIGAVTEMVTGIPTDQITKGKTVVKGMVIETKIVADPGIEIEIGGIGVAPEKAPNPEAVTKVDTRIEGRVEMIPEIVTGLNLDLDPLLMSVLIETEAGVIGAMNMTILPENALMIHQVEIQMMPKALF